MRQKVKISGEKVMELQDDICTILAKKFYLYHYKISKFSDCIIFEVDGYNEELSCVTKDIIEALQKEKEKIINKALILYEKTLLDPECSFLNTHELFSDGTSYSAFLTYYGFKSRKNYLKGVQVSSFDLQLYHLLALIDNALYDYQLLKKKNLLYEKSELFLKKVRKNPDISSDDLKKMGFNASYQKALKRFQNAKPDDEIVKKTILNIRKIELLKSEYKWANDYLKMQEIYDTMVKENCFAITNISKDGNSNYLSLWNRVSKQAKQAFLEQKDEIYYFELQTYEVMANIENKRKLKV